MSLSQTLENKLLIPANRQRGLPHAHSLVRGLTLAVKIDQGEDFVRLVLSRPRTRPSALELETVLDHWPFAYTSTGPSVASSKINKLEGDRQTITHFLTVHVHMDLDLIPIGKLINRGGDS